MSVIFCKVFLYCQFCSDRKNTVIVWTKILFLLPRFHNHKLQKLYFVHWYERVLFLSSWLLLSWSTCNMHIMGYGYISKLEDQSQIEHLIGCCWTQSSIWPMRKLHSFSYWFSQFSLITLALNVIEVYSLYA